MNSSRVMFEDGFHDNTKYEMVNSAIRKCTFNDLPVEVQVQCGLPCPLNRQMVEHSRSMRGTYAHPLTFFEQLFYMNEEYLLCLARQFFQGRLDQQMAEDGIDKLKVSECIGLIERAESDCLWNLVAPSLRTARIYGPKVSLDDGKEDLSKTIWGNAARLILGMAFHTGSLCNDDVWLRSLLATMYRDVFKAAVAVADDFKADSTKTLTDIFLFKFPKCSLKQTQSWCMDMLASYNADFLKDRLSVIHVLSSGKAMKGVCSLGEYTLSRLVRVCFKAIKALQDRCLDENARGPLSKLNFAFNVLVHALGLEKESVEDVLNGNHNLTAEVAKKYPNILYFISRERLKEYDGELIPKALFATFGIDEKAYYLVKTKFNVNFGGQDSVRWASLRILDGIARGFLDKNVFEDGANVKLVFWGCSFLREFCELVERLDDQQIDRIWNFINHPWMLDGLGEIFDKTKPVPKYLWILFERLDVESVYKNYRRKNMLEILIAKSKFERQNISTPLFSKHPTRLACLERFDVTMILAPHRPDVPANQPDLFINGAFFNELQIRQAVARFSSTIPTAVILNNYNNRSLDVIHGESPANTDDDVTVKVKFLPTFVDEQHTSFVITVPKSCRIIDLYWIMYATRVGSVDEEYIYPLADPNGTPVPFTELVKNHPDLRFVELNLAYEWVDQQIEALQAQEGYN